MLTLIIQRTPVKLTIKQAAAYLNLSEVTVRRRIKQGELSAIKEKTPQGFVWMIELAEVRGADQPIDHVEYAATTQLPDQRLITELEDQVTWLRQELEDRKREHDRDRDDWRNEIERLHTLMAQQGQTLQALSATVQEIVPEGTERPESAAEETQAREAFTGEGRILAAKLDGPQFGNLSAKDRLLLRDALELECDAFLTMERRLPTRAAHVQREVGIQILRPSQYWELLKPWARLYI